MLKKTERNIRKDTSVLKLYSGQNKNAFGCITEKFPNWMSLNFLTITAISDPSAASSRVRRAEDALSYRVNAVCGERDIKLDGFGESSGRQKGEEKRGTVAIDAGTCTMERAGGTQCVCVAARRERDGGRVRSSRRSPTVTIPTSWALSYSFLLQQSL